MSVARLIEPCLCSQNAVQPLYFTAFNVNFDV